MNQELLEQFLGLLEASSSFKLLNPEQQAAIKAGYENATDDNLNQAIQTLKADKVATDKLAAEDEKREEELEVETVNIKTAIREGQRDERKEAEAADQAASEGEVDDLLNELDSMDEEKKAKTEPKKKKFMGIF